MATNCWLNKVIYGLALPFTEKKIPFGSPRRGDIIVFKNPGEPSVDFVKRLVGLPGDTIRLRGMDLFINGLPVERRLIGETRTEDGMGELYWEKLGEAEHRVIYHPRRAPHQNYDPRLATRYDFCRLDEGYLECIIPEGQYFFMGDNRDNSNDSRFWGFVPESHLRGKASLVHFAWPPSQWRERIGTVLR
jgi:signal peptidase I